MKTILSLLVLALLFTACDWNRVFEENTKFADNNWEQKNKVLFKVNIKDTISAHNLYINVRNAGFYPFSNIFLFMTTTLPNGKIAKDTIECVLANPDGSWKGSGLGDIWDNQILFKKRFLFPLSGEYQFEFEQAMRVNPLPGIMDMGIRIEKVKK